MKYNGLYGKPRKPREFSKNKGYADYTNLIIPKKKYTARKFSYVKGDKYIRVTERDYTNPSTDKFVGLIPATRNNLMRIENFSYMGGFSPIYGGGMKYDWTISADSPNVKKYNKRFMK